MKTRLVAPPWGSPELTEEAIEAVKIIGDGLWADSSVEFYAQRDAKLNAGKRAPKGMQQTLNRMLEEKFSSNDWYGNAGYFVKNETWVRITFRHQMSLGSDLLDALKVCKKEGIKLAVILAASRETLNLISPNDAPALVSFEKLQREVMALDGAMDIPLLIGELSPISSASQVIDDSLRKSRPRDVTVPASG